MLIRDFLIGSRKASSWSFKKSKQWWAVSDCSLYYDIRWPLFAKQLSVMWYRLNVNSVPSSKMKRKANGVDYRVMRAYIDVKTVLYVA